MNRRAFLATATATLSGIAGCLGQSNGSDGTTTTSTDTTTTSTNTTTPTGPKNGDDLPKDENPADGYPPEFEQTPEERSIDTSSYETTKTNGVEVPLAPIEDVYYWYARGEARIADARGKKWYDTSHVFGAVLSTAGGMQSSSQSDPATQWPKGDRIVCYCGCPHHLSSIRASDLISNGYEEVYVIDEGFGAWQQQNFPMAGSDVSRMPQAKRIRGETDAKFAGKTAWAFHEPSGQREATKIAADGSYEMELKFLDVTSQSIIDVRTPEYQIQAPLGTLTSDVVTGSF